MHGNEFSLLRSQGIPPTLNFGDTSRHFTNKANAAVDINFDRDLKG